MKKIDATWKNIKEDLSRLIDNLNNLECEIANIQESIVDCANDTKELMKYIKIREEYEGLSEFHNLTVDELKKALNETIDKFSKS